MVHTWTPLPVYPLKSLATSTFEGWSLNQSPCTSSYCFRASSQEQTASQIPLLIPAGSLPPWGSCRWRDGGSKPCARAQGPASLLSILCSAPGPSPHTAGHARHGFSISFNTKPNVTPNTRHEIEVMWGSQAVDTQTRKASALRFNARESWRNFFPTWKRVAHTDISTATPTWKKTFSTSVPLPLVPSSTPERPDHICSPSHWRDGKEQDFATALCNAIRFTWGQL